MPRKKQPAFTVTATRIAEARMTAVLGSQADFAILLGVSHGLVGQWESGLKLPGKENLFKIALLTGVSQDYLLGKVNELKRSLVVTDDYEIQIVLASRRMEPIGKQRLAELLTEGIKIRRKVQQEAIFAKN